MNAILVIIIRQDSRWRVYTSIFRKKKSTLSLELEITYLGQLNSRNTALAKKICQGSSIRLYASIYLKLWTFSIDLEIVYLVLFEPPKLGSDHENLSKLTNEGLHVVLLASNCKAGVVQVLETRFWPWQISRTDHKVSSHRFWWKI